jgi:hypothetical protein
MLRFAVVCAALSLASPLWADCVTFKSVTKGITVTQADGSIWTVRRGARNGIRMDQTNADGIYAKYFEGPYGIFPTESTRNSIGSTAEYVYAKPPPEPSLTMNWTSNYKINNISHYDKSRQDWRRGKVHVTAADLREVTISGCPYRVMGVDVAETADGRTTVLHYAYFPDLRFGTQTRITSNGGTVEEAGIVAMQPMK